ncbi:MAG: hypothetical protein D6711_00145 [Chloroflexi bacterium]|nr:MAG: hypothetical protein D6711_00145 [Chloroflexota bacterium]
MHQTQFIEYTYDLDNHIHIFYVKKKTRQAVDEYAMYLRRIGQEIQNSSNPPQVLRMILDIRETGVFPLQYLFSKLRAINAEYPNIPPTYLAYITDSTGDIALINNLQYASAVKQTNYRQVFTPAQYDEAIAWLKTQ